MRVAHWVLTRPEFATAFFYQDEVARSIGDANGLVKGVLDTLAGFKMLERLPRLRGQRAQYYRYLDSPLWEIFQAAEKMLWRSAAELERLPATGNVS